MEIRRAQTEDAGAFADQMKQVVNEERWLASQSDRSVEQLNEMFQSSLQDDALVFVLERDGEIVGGIGIHPTGIAGVHNLGMWILKDFRGQGWGRRLIETAVGEALAKGVRKVVLEVFSDNARAIALYISSGFEIEGFKRDHYPRRDGSVRSTIMMARFL